MRFSRILATAVAFAALSVGVTRSNAAPITNLFNTGTNASNVGIATSGAGTFPADLHYTVPVAPAGNPAGTVAIVVNSAPGFFPTPPWIANSATSDWISGPQIAGTGPNQSSPNGNYTYRTTFTTSDLGAISIAGTLTADDRVLSIVINGVAATTTGLPTTDQGYATLFPFTATAPGTINGTNTLDFIVANTNGVVQGLRVDALTGSTITAGIPEPSSIIILGSGLMGILGLGGLRRLKKVAA